MKQKVIFADKHIEQQPVQPSVQQPQTRQHAQDNNIVLSRNDYREIVKEAYNEGIEDAKENLEQKQESAHQTKESDEERSAETVKRDQVEAHHYPKKKQKKKTSGITTSSQFEKLEVRQDTQEETAKQGKKAAIKQVASDKESAREHFRAIAQRHDIELMKGKTIFPFTFFTDTITIDTVKVSLVHKKFFGTYDITTIPLKDLADVGMQTLLFLGSLDLKYMPQANSGGTGMIQPIETRIANLPKSAALKAKNILKGAMVAKAEGVDISKLTPKEVVNVLDEFGKDKYNP